MGVPRESVSWWSVILYITKRLMKMSNKDKYLSTKCIPRCYDLIVCLMIINNKNLWKYDIFWVLSISLFDIQMIYNIFFSKNMTRYDLVPNKVYMKHMSYPISIHCYYQYNKTSMVYENKNKSLYWNIHLTW